MRSLDDRTEDQADYRTLVGADPLGDPARDEENLLRQAWSMGLWSGAAAGPALLRLYRRQCTPAGSERPTDPAEREAAHLSGPQGNSIGYDGRRSDCHAGEAADSFSLDRPKSG